MIILLLYVFIALIILFLILIYFCFSFAFVKHNIGDFDNLDDDINKPIIAYKEIVKKGMDYIDNTPHTLHNVLSFDGLKLSALYFDNKSDKTVILFHGYRSSAKRDFSCAVEMYSKLGFNVLLCDQRSHGKSEGRLITFGIKESKDVLSWCDYAIYKLLAKQILLGGMSMGATTVLLSCNYNLKDNVKGIVADCGFSSPIDIIKTVGKKIFKLNISFIIPFVNLLCLLFGKFSLYNHSTLDAVKKSDIPIPYIHGKADNFVPFSMSESTYNAKKNNRKLFAVENADHGLSFLVDTKGVMSALTEFITENFT